MKKILLAICCSTLLAPAAFAQAEATAPQPDVTPAVPDTQPTTPEVSEAPPRAPDLARVIGSTDPLADAIGVSCFTCFQAFQECKASCGGQAVCIESFDCNTGDPCNSSCVCTSTCPPSP
jgi:hypothetical protein